jgi:hypothetical protein
MERGTIRELDGTYTAPFFAGCRSGLWQQVVKFVQTHFQRPSHNRIRPQYVYVYTRAGTSFNNPQPKSLECPHK